MAQDQASRTFYHSTEDLKKDDSMHDVRVKFFSTSISCLAASIEVQSDADYEKAMSMICDARRIILTGFGASAALCYYMLFRLTELGFNCMFHSVADRTAGFYACKAFGLRAADASEGGQRPDRRYDDAAGPDVHNRYAVFHAQHPHRQRCILETVADARGLQRYKALWGAQISAEKSS